MQDPICSLYLHRLKTEYGVDDNLVYLADTRLNLSLAQER